MAKHCEESQIFLQQINAMQTPLLFFILLFSLFSTAQNKKVLNGKVVAPVKDLQDINITNLQNGKEVTTDSEGVFAIFAQVGDTLLLTSVQLQTRRIAIEKEDFEYVPFFIKMQPAVTMLKEVVVESRKIDAVSLGIIPKKVRIYTPAERKYYTATTGSGIIPVDAIINAITGKTKELKKNIVIEKHERIQSRLLGMFEEDFFINELKIPQAYVNGFVVFAAEKEKIANAVMAKNKTLVRFLLGELASDYTRMIKDEE